MVLLQRSKDHAADRSHAISGLHVIPHHHQPLPLPLSARRPRSVFHPFDLHPGQLVISPGASSLLPRPSTTISVGAIAKLSPNFSLRSMTSFPAEKSPRNSPPSWPMPRRKPAASQVNGEPAPSHVRRVPHRNLQPDRFLLDEPGAKIPTAIARIRHRNRSHLASQPGPPLRKVFLLLPAECHAALADSLQHDPDITRLFPDRDRRRNRNFRLSSEKTEKGMIHE